MSRGSFELMSVHYRAFHMINLVLFAGLAISGLLISYTDDYEILQTLVKPLGAPVATLQGLNPEEHAVSSGLLAVRLIHRFVAVLWGAAILGYLVVLFATGNIRVFEPLRRSPSEIYAEAKAVLLRYTIGKPIPKEVEERMWRHNVLVSLAVIVLAIGAALISISGSAIVLLPLSPEQHRLMLTLHNVGFYLTVIFLAAHWFASLHPANIPLLKAMFGDGRVTVELAEHHMKAYFEKIKDKVKIE